jgi:hypothetical protein
MPNKAGLQVVHLPDVVAMTVVDAFNEIHIVHRGGDCLHAEGNVLLRQGFGGQPPPQRASCLATSSVCWRMACQPKAPRKRRRRLVGAARFELATFWSQTRRSTRLSYAPDGRVGDGASRRLSTLSSARAGVFSADFPPSAICLIRPPFTPTPPASPF